MRTQDELDRVGQALDSLHQRVLEKFQRERGEPDFPHLNGGVVMWAKVLGLPDVVAELHTLHLEAQQLHKQLHNPEAARERNLKRAAARRTKHNQ